jgi:hypothetical protein
MHAHRMPRLDVPYFVIENERDEHGRLNLSLSHGTVAMTEGCSVCTRKASVSQIDRVLLLNGDLVEMARTIARTEKN